MTLAKYRIWPQLLSWPTALFGIVVVKAVLALTLKRDASLLQYGGVVYLLLLLLATGLLIRNAIQNTLEGRSFWVFLGIACSLWVLNQSLFSYYQFVLQADVPSYPIADPLLFLHLVPLMAAVATTSHRNLYDGKLYRTILDSLLLLFFWSFIYFYAVFSYRNDTSCALRFDTVYLLETWALVLTVGILSLHVAAPWKPIFLHLLGACTLYACSSALANIAIDSGGYVNGRLYGVGLTASACWFVWIPLRARRAAGLQQRGTPSDTRRDSSTSAWAMIVVVIISVPILWELFQKDNASGVRRTHLLVAIVAILCLASAAYIRVYLSKSELASHLSIANERFRLSVQAGNSVGWEWNLKTNRNSWFGDLHTVFGASSDSYMGLVGDFFLYIHPEDRNRVAKAVDDARQNREPYAAELRIIRLDGKVRWVTSKGRFFYSPNGEPERMLGIAADITERKRAEEELHESEEKLRLLLDSTAEAIFGMDLEDRCTFCNPAGLRFLGYDRVDELLGKHMHSMIHPSHAKEGLYPLEQCPIYRASRIGEAVHVDDAVLWRADGTCFPAEYWCYPQRKGQELLGTVVTFLDITERKQAEATLAGVSRRLIGAQEQERTRIARELHDDIGQRLSLLAIGLEKVAQTPNTSPSVLNRVHELQEQTSEIAGDIKSLSHELHSSRLRYLGVAGAMKGFCREFGEKHSVEIDFTAQEVPDLVPEDISLSFFRVMQQALQNAVKHSGVQKFEVRLWGALDELHLKVSDGGVGFDIKAAKSSEGIGIISMQERLKSVNATLAIESQPGHGTTIYALAKIGATQLEPA